MSPTDMQTETPIDSVDLDAEQELEAAAIDGAEQPADPAEAEIVAEEAPVGPPAEMDRPQALRLLEAMLFAAVDPMTPDAISARLPKNWTDNAEELLTELEGVYAGRGVNLLRVAGKFALRTAPDLVDALKMERTVSRKLSRAAVETLSVIAYHQPVTRAEVEEVRGVALSRGTLEILMEAGWIKPKGHRETPGRPATWVTTEQFLLHFGLDKLQDLPGVEDLKSMGLLDARPAVSAYSEDAGLTFPDAPGEAAEREEGAEDAEIGDAAPEAAETQSEAGDTPRAG